MVCLHSVVHLYVVSFIKENANNLRTKKKINQDFQCIFYAWIRYGISHSKRRTVHEHSEHTHHTLIWLICARERATLKTRHTHEWTQAQTNTCARKKEIPLVNKKVFLHFSLVQIIEMYFLFCSDAFTSRRFGAVRRNTSSLEKKCLAGTFRFGQIHLCC